MSFFWQRLLPLLGLVVLCGCNGGGRRAEVFGKTYYIDGAGNLGFGTAEVPSGLRKAGYRGDVEVYLWTTSFNPLLDQLNILGAATGAGRRLAGKIKAYKRKYPDQPVNIIALSAGTGVAVWACENLDRQSQINNLILLGSSLSHNYDMSRALRNIHGRVYVYHSPVDSILSTVEVVGTIDRKTGVKSAGQVGLRPPAGAQGKIVNIAWSDRWRSLGWHGGHTDCTNERFVRTELAKHIEGITERSEPVALFVKSEESTVESAPVITSDRGFNPRSTQPAFKQRVQRRSHRVGFNSR